MIGSFDRYCPKCGAGISRYNGGQFCWPCTPPEGCVWHWSEVTHEWVLLGVFVPEREWEPKPGDIVLGEAFKPAPRRAKVDNWDRWRRIEETAHV